MKRHFLVTVSEDASVQYGLRFVGNFFKDKTGVALTLFYTAPQPPKVWENELSYETVQQAEQQTQAIERKGRAALAEAKAKIVTMGFPAESVHVKLQFRQNSKVDDIVQEAERGLYDAMVLGRRGLTALEEALLEKSVSRGLLCSEFSCPLWICRKPDLDRMNVLVAVDGSESSLRVVDHVGFVLAQEKRHRVVLLNVQTPNNRRKVDPENLFQQCRALLAENEFPDSLIQNRQIESSDPGKAILAQAQEEKFAAVAVGRSGSGGCGLRDMFLGSVSFELFKELSGSVLWVHR